MLLDSILSLDYAFFHHISEQPLSYVFPALLLVLTLVSASRRHGSKSDIPLFVSEEGSTKKRWMSDALNLLREGHKKFPNEPFQLSTSEGSAVVIPPKFVDELKMLPDSTFPSSLADFLQGEHTTFGAPWKGQLDLVPHIIKHDLNKNLPKMFPEVIEEVESALDVEFPRIEDWTPLKIHSKVMRVVCRVSGRAFVGDSFQRNEEWIQMNCDYTRDVFISAAIIRMFHPLLRPVAKYFIPSIRRVWKHNQLAERLLTPILKQRNHDEKLPGYEKPNDTIEWIRDSLYGGDKDDYLFQAINQLSLGAASLHTTSQMVTAVLYNLATHPEYIPILRQEAGTVLAANDGIWTIDSMSSLRKLDSFMKESQRFDPSTIIGFQRKTLKPITLSSGLTIPAHMTTFSASEAVSSDPDVYTSPEVFDGLRFYHLRLRSPEDERRGQFVSTSKTELHFGAGRHACPGRWFASYEIKLIVLYFLDRYDLKLKEGLGRPKNWRFQTMNSPDPNGELLLKSRCSGA